MNAESKAQSVGRPLDLTFVAGPPPINRTRGRRYEKVARQLKKRPGEWGLCFRSVSPTVAAYARKSPALPSTQFEVETEPVGDGTFDVYIRFKNKRGKAR